MALLEQVLDVAMSLCNLNLRVRLDLLGGIVARPRHAPGSHIITPHLEPNLKIPKALKVSDDKFPAHLRAFAAAMAALGPTIHKIIVRVGNFDIFSNRVHKRGENLFLAGNVVQVTVEAEPLGIWRVCFKVWASFKRVLYLSYARLSAVEGVKDCICECKNG